MKFTLLLFSFFMFQSFGWSQSDTLNRTDEAGKKQGYWIYYGKDKTTAGLPENELYREGAYKDDSKVGLWKIYHNDGVHIRLEGNYENNLPSGNYKKFWKNGTLMEEGTFYNKVYINSRKKYFINGILSSNEYYDSLGKITDTAYFYFETGCLQRVKIHNESTNQIETKIYHQDSCNVVRKISSAPIYESMEVVWGEKDVKRRNQIKSNPPVINSAESMESWSIYPKWKPLYSNEALCSDEKGTIKKKNEDGEYIFIGVCKDGQIWSGRMFFYDSTNILLRSENWEEGTFSGTNATN